MDSKNAHLYLPFVQALAEGKVVEYHSGDDEWITYESYTFSSPPEEYRIAKPKTILKSRRYIWKDSWGEKGPRVGVVNNIVEASFVEKQSYFVRWIDKTWVETEV